MNLTLSGVGKAAEIGGLLTTLGESMKTTTIELKVDLKIEVLDKEK